MRQEKLREQKNECALDSLKNWPSHNDGTGRKWGQVNVLRDGPIDCLGSTKIKLL